MSLCFGLLIFAFLLRPAYGADTNSWKRQPPGQPQTGGSSEDLEPSESRQEYNPVSTSYHFGPFFHYEKGVPIESPEEEAPVSPRVEQEPRLLKDQRKQPAEAWLPRREAEEKGTRLDLLGPLFSYHDQVTAQEYILRPLFRWKRGPGYQDLEFLYPLGKYRRAGGQGGIESPSLVRFLPFLATERSPEPGEEAKWNYFFLFPYYSAQSKEGERFWGIFPLYGRLKDWFGKDEIRFYLWPIYSASTEEGSVTRHVLFPLFSWTEGPGERGWKIWPLYGKKEREGEFSQSFVLWPFYLSARQDLSGEAPEELFAILPFYLKREARGTRTTGILYPFFTHTENEREGFRSWGLPWPFVQKAEGKGIEKLWIFPFGGKTHQEGWDSRFILWPLYTYTRAGEEGEVTREVHRFLLIHRSERVLWKQEGKEGRYLHLWPLFTYQRDKEQRVRLSILSLLPLEEEGFERHYAPLFRLYGYTRQGADRFDSKLLWGLYRRTKDPQEDRIDLSFLASWRRKASSQGVEITILKGLFDYRSQPGQRSVRLLYLPWRIGG